VKFTTVAAGPAVTNANGTVIAQTASTGSQAGKASLVESNWLQVSVLPNPSTSQFNVNIRSANKKDRITLVVVDAFGRVIEQRQNLTPEQTQRIGAMYRPGVYLIEARQGTQKQTIKVIKL
jgi:hypothetical protein